jgi:hypothetical protein
MDNNRMDTKTTAQTPFPAHFVKRNVLRMFYDIEDIEGNIRLKTSTC